MEKSQKKEISNLQDNLKNYIIIKKIGQGAHGIVYKAKNIITSEIVAIKKIDQIQFEKKKRKNILNEAMFLKKLKNENIISLKSFFFENKNLYLIMEYAEKGDLQKYIKKRLKTEKKNKKKKKIFSEKKIWELALKIFSGLKYIHSNNIIHRDIKPSNIFIDSSNNIKIGDFGVSKYYEKNVENKTRVGTPLYLSPELVMNMNYCEKVS